MKFKSILFISLSVALVIASCAAKKTIALAQTDADRAAAIFPGATLASLNQGKTLYENNCASCHNLKKPTSESETAWRNIVPGMAKKAKVDASTESLILQYVVTMSKSGN